MGILQMLPDFDDKPIIMDTIVDVYTSKSIVTKIIAAMRPKLLTCVLFF
jgi:hypothetical protein